jgi:hypothetical protein
MKELKYVQVIKERISRKLAKKIVYGNSDEY